jgi:hypothetical protein
MRFLLLVCVDPDAEVPADLPDIQVWLDEVETRGTRLLGDQLDPPSAARSVRVRGGSIVTTDGPFAETKEFVAGFDVVECDSMEDAVAIAAQHPVARFGAIEVRRFWKG